jgi:hypothetical protein
MMELDIWLGQTAERAEFRTLEVQETVAGSPSVRFTVNGESALLTREEVRTLFLSLKYWYDLGEDS